MRNQLVLPITEITQVAAARRLATGLAHGLGFSETIVGKVALVVTECATNLVKHTTRGGELLVRALEWHGIAGIEIFALDKGPGIANVAEAMQDGYSTAGSSGTGIGAIARLSDFFDIYSAPDVGTAILTRLWAKPLPQDQPISHIEVGVVCLAKSGEEVSGDAWAVQHEINKSRILVADGLGHGSGAAEAANEAVKVFMNTSQLSLTQTIDAMHKAMRHTRGAVIGLVEIDIAQQLLYYAGLGNIEGSIYTPDNNTHNLVSHNGTVGYELGKVHEYTYPFPRGAILVIHSDGCTSQLTLAPYLGLARKSASLIASVLYRDFNRGRDDVTVVVAKPVN